MATDPRAARVFEAVQNYDPSQGDLQTLIEEALFDPSPFRGNPEYEPTTPETRLDYLSEEAGEVISAIGKIGRFGLEKINPTLPPEKRRTNREALLAEMYQLEGAIEMVRRDLLAPTPILTDGCRHHVHIWADSMFVYAPMSPNDGPCKCGAVDAKDFNR